MYGSGYQAPQVRMNKIEWIATQLACARLNSGKEYVSDKDADSKADALKFVKLAREIVRYSNVHPIGDNKELEKLDDLAEKQPTIL